MNKRQWKKANKRRKRDKVLCCRRRLCLKDRVEAYKAFMYNPDNVRNCLECPENIGNSSNLPCGQQNCWVSCHCNN